MSGSDFSVKHYRGWKIDRYEDESWEIEIKKLKLQETKKEKTRPKHTRYEKETDKNVGEEEKEKKWKGKRVWERKSLGLDWGGWLEMRFDVRTSAHFLPNREGLISMKKLSVHAAFH